MGCLLSSRSWACCACLSLPGESCNAALMPSLTHLLAMFLKILERIVNSMQLAELLRPTTVSKPDCDLCRYDVGHLQALQMQHTACS